MAHVTPDLGKKVHVWPHPGVSVRAFADLPRILPAEGQELPWSPWLSELHGQGLVHLSDPAPKASKSPASPLKE